MNSNHKNKNLINEPELNHSEILENQNNNKVIKSKNNNSSLILNDKSEYNAPSDFKNIQADNFEKYINQNGINSTFQLIFSEIIYKKIPVEDHFTYAAGRLRQIGREVESIKNKVVNK